MNENFGLKPDEVLAMTYENALAMLEEKYHMSKARQEAIKGDDGDYVEVETFDGVKKVKVGNEKTI